MRRYFSNLLVIVLASSCGFAQSTQPEHAPPATEPAQTVPGIPQQPKMAWASLDQKTRDQLTGLLQSPDWPIRVFGLLRLERYSGAGTQELVKTMLHDSAWQVRCFAIREMSRMELDLRTVDFSVETNPQVIRAALRFGGKCSDELITKIATELLRAKNVEDLMLGLELAAASNIEPLRAEAERRVTKLVRNMNGSVAALLSRRLAIVLGLSKAPVTPQQWHTWAKSQPEIIKLAPRESQRGNDALAAPPLVSDIDDEAFTRLLDYLGSLRQRDLDLVIVMDATASMLPMVDQARAGIDSLILFLDDISREMRLAFVAYRDHDNKPVWDGHPFTTDVASIRKFLFDLRITGGADYPEAVLEGLEACGELKWNRKATREIVLVGDAPPHEEDVYRIRALMDSYRDSGIVVHAAHVPMEYPRGYLESMTPIKVIEAQRWLEDYNTSTGESFAGIAEAGGGRKTEMNKADELVPSIMHFTIEEAWWSVFDEFYEMYVRLCR